MAGSDEGKQIPAASCWRWGEYVLVRCPYCAGAHIHGWDSEPDGMVRTSHCQNAPRGEYELDMQPGPPPGWMRTIRNETSRVRPVRDFGGAVHVGIDALVRARRQREREAATG